MYDLRGDGPDGCRATKDGVKNARANSEVDGLAHPQGYVRRLVEDKSSKTFKLEDAIVDVDKFQRAVCDPDAKDLLPVLCVPRRYFKRENQAWLLLPGYESRSDPTAHGKS